MAIGDDFTISTSGDIRHTANTNHYTVLELHRWLQDLADDPEATYSTSDLVDITSATPSERSTDQIITLLNNYNIDDDAAEYFYGGSITQDSGDTVYSGLKVLGAVNSSATQIQVIQDHGLYDGDAPFWGTQASPYNGGGSTLMRVLVKSRENGYDIDQKQIRVRVAHWGDTFDFFNVTLGEGEAVAAVSSVDDPQNDTASGTVAAYTHVTNTEGYQQIDIGDGNGNQPYYSQWTYGTDDESDQLKSVWEWGKYITRTATSSTLHGTDGELFLGPTHSYAYDNGSAFTEDEVIVWGTHLWYDALAGGTFTEGYYVTIGSNDAAGRIGYDDGVDEMYVALDDTSITILDDDTITEYNPSTGAASGVTAVLDTGTGGGSPVEGQTNDGGTALLLAATGTTTGSHFFQLLTGEAPADDYEVVGATSTNTCDVNGTVSTKTVPKVFLGSYVGTLIGAYGIGVKSTDLTSSDTVTDLDGDVNTPPNNVTFTVYGLASGEDRVLVGPKAAGNDFDYDQMALNTGLTANPETNVDVGTGNIPDNTPASGILRIATDNDIYLRVPYSAHDGDDGFTVNYDFSGDNNCSSTNFVFLGYIDRLANAGNEAYTTIYTSGPQLLWVRVRDGGGTPIKTYEAQGTLNATGGSATASRITDA